MATAAPLSDVFTRQIDLNKHSYFGIRLIPGDTGELKRELADF